MAKLGENLVNSPGFFLTWWKPGDILKLGENLVKTWWIHQVLVNLVKIWWNGKTWWKPGEFTKFFLTWWKSGEILKLGENLVKTWWIHQVFENSPNQKSRSVLWLWNSPKEAFLKLILVKIIRFGGEIWRKNHQYENLVKTWWKPGEFTKFFKFGENLVKFEKLVKTWWIHQVFFKLGENLVKWQNLVKTWWIHQVFFF